MLCIFVKFYARQCEMKHRMLRLMQQKAYNSGNRRRMSHREAKARRSALQEMKEKYERKSEKWLCTLGMCFVCQFHLFQRFYHHCTTLAVDVGVLVKHITVSVA